MRPMWLVVLAGCADETLDAPDDCRPDELHVIHGDLDERIPVSNFIFVNALGDSPGVLSVGGQQELVHIEFTKLAARGSTVPARGSLTLPAGPSVGDCETGELDGLILVDEEFWRFELVGLATAPFCSGAAVEDSVQGCFRAAPFADP